MKKKLVFRTLLLLALLVPLLALCTSAAETTDAQTTEAADGTPGISVSFDGLNGESDGLEVLFMLTVIALAPSILIMTTSFTRIIIVLSCVRNAIGLQQTPPNQVLIGIALFLSLFIMAPVVDQIKEEAYVPYKDGELTQTEAVDAAMQPLRSFMLKQTKPEDLNMFLSLSGSSQPESYDEIRTTVIIPAFITSELKRAFIIGFMVYLPFLVIDMVVASTLMSMGMMMLPPVMISLPFKLILFVLVDGWGLTMKTLVTSFN